MKNYLKFISLILVISLVISMTGCSSIVSMDDLDSLESQIDDLESQVDDLEDELKEYIEASRNQINEPIEEDSADAPKQPEKKEELDPSAFPESDVLQQLEITEYSYSTDYANYVFLVIKNNSDFDITVYGEMIFRDGKDSLVGTTSNEERAFEAGQEIILDFYTDTDFATYDYTLSVGIEEYYDSILSLLESEVSTTDSKAILAITNTGDKPAEFVQYTVLFFEAGVLIDYDWGYCTDDDSEIKPGKTNYSEANTYESFDSILLFLSGKASKD